MKNLKKVMIFIAALVFVQFLYLGLIQNIKAETVIPNSYDQNLSINGTYVYEVSQFGDSTKWYNFTPFPDNSYEGDWKTNPEGQIRINITGFYNKDPNDWGNIFGDPIPWYNIEIFQNNQGILTLNFTLSNRSNSEVSRALTLGYNSFQPGFLIPDANITYIKELALIQADPGGLYDITGELKIEESYNFLYIGFSQIGGEQNTELIYDKWTGLLVWAKTSIFGYLLEIKSLNFTLDYSSAFKYDIIRFGGAVDWYNLTFGSEGKWGTNIGGQIEINFTGFYNKDPNDWGNIIDDPIPWFDLEIIKNISGVLMTNFTLVNRSNSELSWGFTLGYNNFQPGFLIHIMDNLTKVKKLALQEATGFVNGIVIIEETQLSVKISFNQVSGGQKTSLIYEKQSGLLLWTNTSVGSYLLEMTINGYVPWSATEEEKGVANDILLRFLPYIIIASITIISISSSILTSRFNKKFKKINKFVIIAILAIASFSSFFVFTSSIKLSEVNEPLKQVENINLVVDYGNGTIREWENFDLSDYNTTAFDTLNKWCDLEYTDYGDMGILIESVDGRRGNWRYSVNGEFPGVSSNKYNLKNGDTVNWIFG
ncbi:MAG: DUF4430 domain-containing protein [Candidatus Thorarchaeota archaeon]